MSLNGEVHERAALFKADDLFYDGNGFSLVEQAHDRGLYGLHDLAACVVACGDILEQERMVAAYLGKLGHFELRLGHNAERTLAAEKQRQKVRAARMLGNGQSVYNVAVGKRHLDRETLIVDLAVFGGKDADAVVCQRAANGAAGKAAGQMHDREALLVCVPFEGLEYHTCFAGDGAGLGVDIKQLIHALDIKDYAACHRQSAALRTASAAPCLDGELVVVRYLEYL